MGTRANTPGSDGGLSRRQFLLGAAGTAAIAGLAGCGATNGVPVADLNQAPVAGKPKRGGNFKVGITGGGSGDIFDGQNIITEPDQARLVTQFETLLTFNRNYEVTNDGLAEEVTQDHPKQWTIRLRKGIEFSNGKTMQAEDVVYSLQRLLDPANGLPGLAGITSLVASGVKALDKYTVRLYLKEADSTINQALAGYTNTVVPVGYAGWPAPQVGTGPYILDSFTPSQQSVSRRNPNYWRTGQPYFDSVSIFDFPDPTAQVNALLAGQIDAMTDLPPSQVPVVHSRGGLSVLVSKTGAWIPLCMAIDMPPFNNNDVRQAMRYLINRPQMVEQVTSGFAVVANDLFGPFDPDYDSALPQLHQDVDQARFLLKKAGMEHASFNLHTTDGAAGMVELASVFASQAAGAGLNVSVQNDPNYYGTQYLKLGFSVDFWGTRGYLPQVAQSMVPTSPFNETHWPPKSGPGSNYASLYKQAVGTTSAALRKEIVHEMQTIEYKYGGYVIPYFRDLVDCYSSKIAGFQPSKGTLNLDSYGNGYRTIWFT